MNLSTVLTQSLSALGYELVEANMSPQGLLRVFIDFPWQPGQAAQAISVDDCERVSRHLSFTLPVEHIDYNRLEVSSPGLDRPLHSVRDYTRFVGCEVSIKFRAATPQMGNRRKFVGVLQAKAEGSTEGVYQLVLTDEEKVMDFEMSEVETARLVPQIVFKKRVMKPKV